jgi:dolichol-phosphate mannosyltransferase
MKCVIVLPTYNERANIALLLDALQAHFKHLPGQEMHVLVVDDSSPDGTADVVRTAQLTMSNVHLLVGQKKGLGAAYIRGIAHAVDHLGAETVMEMDADFSHKPQDVARLLVNIEYGADFVIGSRYVPGGTIPGEWTLYRQASSLFGNIVARYIAGLYRVRDCTAGFRAIRTSLLQRINFRQLRVQGYAFQVALLHAAVIAGAKVVEVPVDFVDRARGVSKLGVRDIAEFIANACWLRFQTSKTFINFLVVGASGVAVNLAVFSFLLRSGSNQFISSPVAIEASIVWNFLLNNYWTFRWRRTGSRTRIRGLKFNAVSLFALVISFSTFVALRVLQPTGSPLLHQFIGIVPATVVNYFLNSYWTFRER